MGRRSSSPGRSSGFGRGRSPVAARRPAPPPPATPKAVAPQPASQVAQPAMAAAPGGGMMANIASTAAGVAIGHTVGHAITGSLMGGGNHEPAAVEQQAVGQPQAQYQQQPQQSYNDTQNPCKLELEQFLSCAQNQANDLTFCDGFNQVLRECKARYGNMYQ